VEKGGVICNAHLAWQSFGTLNAKRDNFYFRAADNAAELVHLANGSLRPMPSIRGHRAGNSERQPGGRSPSQGGGC
jgi:hypothetical protein